MKSTQSVLPGDLSEDLRDERGDALNVILLISSIVSLLLYVSFSQFNPAGTMGLQPKGFLVLFVCTILSYLILKSKRVDSAGYVFITGLTFSVALQLAYVGPNATIYALLVLPIAVASLVLEYSEMSIVTTMVSLSAVVFASFSIGFGPSIVPSVIPIMLYCTLAAIFYLKNFQSDERIRWTLDNQRKDNRRAEMFYDQSEQLQKAYLEVQHYSSKLEMVNKQLAEAQKQAEQASKAKSTFLSNMSHELRTPLNVIIGYSNSMLNMPKMFQNKSLSEAHKPFVQLIEENGHYLVGLISDVLDLGKIEAGKLELHRDATELPSLFRGVMATSVGLLKGKPVQLRSDFPENLPKIWADPMRVRQIILNLMSNALKFTESGSVTLSARVEDDCVKISVTDTGIGIPESALAVIFDRFQQAENDTDKKYGGTGLGLDISKQLSLMHGGNLTVTSEVGRGSVFTVTLPISAERITGEVNAAPRLDSEMQVFESATDSEQEMILLVEDDMNTRRLLRTILEQANYVVVDTNTGEEALDLASGLLPAAIILDVYLPDISGWDVLQMLKQNGETAIIPVVVCTADENRIPEDELYPSYYLRKPATPEALLNKVEQALRALKQVKVDV
ncbi:MAG: response regulator [Anaerolineaceae bacterium]|nr:response regulator [Anaerolineaceae bacterium]